MPSSRRKTRTALFCLALLALLNLGCVGLDLVEKLEWNPSDGAKQEDAGDGPGGSTSESAERPSGSSEGIVFTFTGDNLAYHTGLLNQSTFYVDYGRGTVEAGESREFEEPAGDIQTRRGTDSVKFDGTYDQANKTITGTLTVRTDGRSSGGEAAARNMTYVMTGQLDARLVDDEWTGTVVGNSTLTQSWEDGTSPEETKHSVNWTVRSTSIERF